MTSDTLTRQAIELAKRPYAIQVTRDETGAGRPVWVATNPDLFGAMGQGESIDEAVEDLADARIEYILGLLEAQVNVPAPSVTV